MPMMTSMAEVPTIRVAVLDDYQQVASRMVEWAAAVPQAEVTFFADHLADPDQLAVRLAGFDVVVAMRERTPFERHLLSRLPRLRLLVTTGMRNAAIDDLINTSRGPIVDERALAEHLRAGRIAGAALDVFGVEPLPPGDPFRTLPNTVLTPHLGYVTERTYRTFYGEAAEDIAAFLSGRPVRLLTPADLSPPRQSRGTG